MVTESAWEIERLESKDQEEEACLGKIIEITQKKTVERLAWMLQNLDNQAIELPQGWVSNKQRNTKYPQLWDKKQTCVKAMGPLRDYPGWASP